jgi:uncharacterized membrane protein YgcG
VCQSCFHMASNDTSCAFQTLFSSTCAWARQYLAGRAVGMARRLLNRQGKCLSARLNPIRLQREAMMKKRILSSLAIIGLTLVLQSCSIYAHPYGHSIGFYGNGPYYGFTYGYQPYGYYRYRPYYRGYRPGYRPGYRSYRSYKYGRRDYGWDGRRKFGGSRSWGGSRRFGGSRSWGGSRKFGGSRSRGGGGSYGGRGRR